MRRPFDPALSARLDWAVTRMEATRGWHTKNGWSWEHMMIMVSGPSKKQRAKYHDHPRFGWLLNPRAGASIRTIVQSGMPWACDNDCFRKLHRRAYLRMLRRVSGQPRLQWVVAPDIVADAQATLVRFRLWQPVLSYYRLPIAFVAQDGQEDLPVPWPLIGCLFIGGSTEWKLSMHAARLIEEAHTRGKWVHVGRISTFDRLDRFDSLPVTSFDTTAVCHNPAHLDRFLARTDYQQHGFLHTHRTGHHESTTDNIQGI